MMKEQKINSRAIENVNNFIVNNDIGTNNRIRKLIRYENECESNGTKLVNPLLFEKNKKDFALNYWAMLFLYFLVGFGLGYFSIWSSL